MPKLVLILAALQWGPFIGPASAQPSTAILLDFAQVWKYEQSGLDLGIAWQAPTYDDTAWPSGPGLLGLETSVPSPYPEPLRTALTLGSITYYFRTHFTYTGEVSGVQLRATNFIDDGAVFYLNGSEVGRVQMPTGPVTYQTFAIVAPVEGVPFVMDLFPGALVQGDNVLAVEVHQANSASSDVVFGMSLHAALTNNLPPVILSQPRDQSVPLGGIATFSVSASGAPPLAYQWQHNGALLGGATNPVLLISSVNTNSAGLYSVSVANAFGVAVSSNAVLTVIAPTNTPPAVLSIFPAFQSVPEGTSASITVAANGTPPLLYQWQHNALELPGQTNASLLLAAAHTNDAGIYRCVVTNPFGLATSPDSVLDVFTPPTNLPPVITSPAGLVLSNVVAGRTAVLGVVATGSLPLSYQWYFNGPTQPIAGAISNSLFFPSTSVADAGTYTVVVSNAFGTATNRGFVLNVSDPSTEGASVNFAITPAMSNVFVFVDSTNRVPVGSSYLAQLYFSFTQDAAALQPVAGTCGFNVPGRFNGGPRKLIGTSSGQPVFAQVRVWEAAFGASYEQAVTAGGRVGKSSLFQVIPTSPPLPPGTLTGLRSFTLTLPVPPQILVPPESVSVTQGMTATFSVVATGSEPLAYQWQFEGLDIAGASGASLSISDAQPAQSGTYSVRVSNEFGSTSSSATLLVVAVNHAPLPVAQVEPVVVLNPNTTNHLILSPNGSNALVILDASLSSDPDNDPLQFYWFIAGEAVPFASGVRVTNAFDVGEHTVVLVADDGRAPGSVEVSFEVITAADAVGELVSLIEESSLPRQTQRPLLITLEAIADSFARGDIASGLRQLDAFCNKVEARVVEDPLLKERLLQACAAIREVLVP